MEDGAPADWPSGPTEDELEILEPAQRGAEHVQLRPITSIPTAYSANRFTRSMREQ